jgi:hypothetical protein
MINFGPEHTACPSSRALYQNPTAVERLRAGEPSDFGSVVLPPLPEGRNTPNHARIQWSGRYTLETPSDQSWGEIMTTAQYRAEPAIVGVLGESCILAVGGCIEEPAEPSVNKNMCVTVNPYNTANPKPSAVLPQVTPVTTNRLHGDVVRIDNTHPGLPDIGDAYVEMQQWVGSNPRILTVAAHHQNNLVLAHPLEDGMLDLVWPPRIAVESGVIRPTL